MYILYIFHAIRYDVGFLFCLQIKWTWTMRDVVMALISLSTSFDSVESTNIFHHLTLGIRALRRWNPATVGPPPPYSSFSKLRPFSWTLLQLAIPRFWCRTLEVLIGPRAWLNYPKVRGSSSDEQGGRRSLKECEMIGIPFPPPHIPHLFFFKGKAVKPAMVEGGSWKGWVRAKLHTYKIHIKYIPRSKGH